MTRWGSGGLAHPQFFLIGALVIKEFQTWLRGRLTFAAFTLLVLMQAGYVEEAIAWRQWLLRAAAGAPDQIQTIYGIEGVLTWTVDGRASDVGK